MFNAKLAVSTLGFTGILAGGVLMAGAGVASAATAQPTHVICKYQAMIWGGHLNVRSGPGVKYRVVGHLYRWEHVTGPCKTLKGWTLIGHCPSGHDHGHGHWKDHGRWHGHGHDQSPAGWVDSKFIKRVK